MTRLDQEGLDMKVCESSTFFQLKVYERGIFSVKTGMVCKRPMQKGKELDLGTEHPRENFAEYLSSPAPTGRQAQWEKCLCRSK